MCGLEPFKILIQQNSQVAPPSYYHLVPKELKNKSAFVHFVPILMLSDLTNMLYAINNHYCEPNILLLSQTHQPH